MDQNVRFRYWQRLLSLPQVWLPAAAGICLNLSGYGFRPMAIGCAISVALLTFLISTKGDKYWALAQDNVRQEERYLRQAQLRDLRRRLRQDNDYRSSQCIRDLQDLYDRIHFHRLLEDDENQHGAASEVLLAVRKQVWELFEAGEQALERSYQLWRAAKDMTNEASSENVLGTREQLLDEVNESLQNLGEALDFLQTGRLNQAKVGFPVSDAGEQLARGLEVARKIHQRLDELEEETRISE